MFTTNTNCSQFTLQQQQHEQQPGQKLLPTCIVIGCKNAYPNPSIKFYQVPTINQSLHENDRPENNISRQWYINTLREDLLDFILAKSTPPNASNLQVSKQPHYVCIEHFDEESFVVPASEPFLLKEDAVPSLFEIEVFQKMIAHQEQTTVNQQKQQKISNQSSNGNNRSNCTDFLSNLILNGQQYQHQPQQQLDLNILSQKTSEKINSGTAVGNQPSTPTLNINSNTQRMSTSSPLTTNSSPLTKRVRMDPDTRAALIQRVPKAVKRTAVQPPSSVQKQNVAVKAQKAVKHTNPSLHYNSALKPSKTIKYPNSSSNISLKDILPPPIMQSTKRPLTSQGSSSNNIPLMNKAVKHPGAGSLAYFNPLNADIPNPVKQALIQAPVNNSNETAMPVNKILVANTTNSSNKITMTTTYVYKRVLQEPEIDLNLECEEEDLIYIVPPLTPPPPSPVKELTTTSADTRSTEAKPSEDMKSIVVSATLPSLVENKKLQANKSTTISRLSSTKDESAIKKKENPNNTSTTTTSTKSAASPLMITKILKKQPSSTQITPVTSSNKSSSNKGNLSAKPSTPVLTAALVKTESSDTSSDSSDDSSTCDFNENQSITSMNNSTSEGTVTSKRIVLKQQLNANIKTENGAGGGNKQSAAVDNSSSISKSVNSYANVLGKFYSRRYSSMANILEMAAGELETSLTNKSISKRGKQHQGTAKVALPADLRVGNYPAKCNICNLILDNNIELTSHICSHLESSGADSNGMSSYISPFDAVTTTCGICDTTFSQPFDLIKHLDQKHMKQLGEYKCRICELQHSKLSDLVAHLNQTHVSQEMPYHCDACGFRTSFYADAIYHIKKEHKSTLRHFCPYCLKSLTLPYNEKLGYVQCQLFYAHLITHFNKHENDTLQPSKCKHCQKCILHVRYMKDHLITDHSTSSYQMTGTNLEASFSLSSSPIKGGNKLKKQSDKQQAVKTESVIGGVEVLSKKQSAVRPSASGVNPRKRRRSTRFEEDTADTNSTVSKASEVNSPANMYDFEDEQIDESSGKFQANNNDELTESSTNETSDTGRLKTFKKYTKGRKASTTPRAKASQESQLNKKARLNNLSNLADHSLTSLICAENSIDGKLIDNNTSVLKIENGQLVSSSPLKQPGRKQKALKQTNVKSLNINSKYHKRRMLDKNRFDGLGYPPVPRSPEIVTMTIAGNVKVSLNKNKFKCVECGDSDVKGHFKNDYTCHQCKYNTNCSNSFEYHLHGHLVSKRVAMWNKVLKTKTEDYKCPCGFVFNSSKDNNFNANTGNKVAAHMLKCEYKYCSVFIEEDSEEVVKKKKISNSDSNDEKIELDVEILGNSENGGNEENGKKELLNEVTVVCDGSGNADKMTEHTTPPPNA